MMKKLIAVCLVTLLTGSMAFANQVVIPPWRGANGSTYQAWEFNTGGVPPVIVPPDDVYNPYGDPELTVKTPFGWENGAWALSGEMDIYLPNRQVVDGWKEIWIQLTWKPAGLDPSKSLPDQPNVAVTPFVFATWYRDDYDMPDDWIVSLYKIEMWPNPLEEWITVKGDIWVDELIIDTICIPEPASMLMLGLGGLALMRKRRV